MTKAEQLMEKVAGKFDSVKMDNLLRRLAGKRYFGSGYWDEEGKELAAIKRNMSFMNNKADKLITNIDKNISKMSDPEKIKVQQEAKNWINNSRDWDWIN